MQDTAELKKAFALALYESPGDAYKVAFALFPDNSQTGQAVIAAASWPTDPEVLSFQAQITRDPNEAGILPSKYQAAREVLARARSCRDDETYVKLMNLYCTIMGQIDKPGAGAVTNVVVQSKVIMMPAPVSRDAWSKSATQQQRQLQIEGEKISASR